MSRWISVEGRLPEPGDSVLVYGTPHTLVGPDLPEVVEGSMSVEHGWWSGSCKVEDVTHWMPLPDPPDQEAPTGCWRCHICRVYYDLKPTG